MRMVHRFRNSDVKTLTFVSYWENISFSSNYMFADRSCQDKSMAEERHEFSSFKGERL